MSEAPKKRAPFQIHLSTAVVLMFVAGMLMYLNVQPRLIDQPRMMDPILSTTYGWPFYARYWLIILDSEEATLQPPNGYIHWPHLLINVLIAQSILALVTLILEWRIKRNRSHA